VTVTLLLVSRYTAVTLCCRQEWTVKSVEKSVPAPVLTWYGARKQQNTENYIAVQRKLVRICVEGNSCGRICKENCKLTIQE
jgi:hypothetical protein